MVMYAYGNGIDEADMPPPDRVVRYGKRSPGLMPAWGAPAMFHYATEGCDPKRIAAEHGFDLQYVTMADDLPEDHGLLAAYERGDDPEEIARQWLPGMIPGRSRLPPEWKLSGMNDSEDGIVAIYLRKRPDLAAPPSEEG